MMFIKKYFKKRLRKIKRRVNKEAQKLAEHTRFASRRFMHSLVDKLLQFRSRQKQRLVKKRTYSFVFTTKLKFFLLGALFSFMFLFFPLLMYIFAATLPNPYTLSLNSIAKTTKIYDRNDNLLYEIYANQNRTVVKLSEVPIYLRQATIAIEDKDFYQHPGFDVKGIIRSAWNNIVHQDLQGGSTITQQLIRSAFLTSEPTLSRKIKEIVLAFLAERIYNKDKILELYFNYVPYGGTAWGVQAASEIYFGKNIKDLDLSESAFLSGLPRAPSVYSPFVSNDNHWKARQREVLNAMVKEKFITDHQADVAYEKELVFRNPQVPIQAPHFVMYIRDLLMKKYGLNEVEKGGLRVRTTLDITIQEMVEKIVREEVENDAYLNIKNGAAVVTNPKNGDILAMVGNYNYFDKEHAGNVNIVTSLRQPGSSIKIVTYSLALSQGFTEATLLDDLPLSIQLPEGNYAPVNYDGKFHGKLPLRYAFANSLNIPAVRVAQKLGVENIVDFGKKMGIMSWGNENRYGLSITLGGADVTMLDLASVYGTVANKGKRIDLDPLIEISDAEGNALYKKSKHEENVLNEGIAFIISDILSDNKARSIEFGFNSPLVVPGRKVSVKTGTSDNKRDNWTIGYTDNVLVASWVGNSDNTPMSPSLTSGITGAAPMWNKIMTNLLKDKQDVNVAIPSNIVSKSCFGYTAYFIKGTENASSCVFPVLTGTVTPSLYPLFPLSIRQYPTPTSIQITPSQLLDFVFKKKNRGRKN